MAKTKPKTNECKYISPEEKKKNEIIKKQKAKKQKQLAAELKKKKKEAEEDNAELCFKDSRVVSATDQLQCIPPFRRKK